jgi:predicted AlkP superfamily phosphohydrolase/phosphomutase
MKTILLGLDGATYTVLDHLIATGVMPHLGEVYQSGARAELLSTPTPLTPQAWTTMATGRSPGHHGILDFIRAESGPHGLFWRLNDARDNHCETVWKYASRHGLRASVLNYIATAPPEPINGHVIPGFVSSRHLRRNCHPADLFPRLANVAGCDPRLLGLELSVEQQALQDLEPALWCDWIGHHVRREGAWRAALEHLMDREPSDLTVLVLDGVDKIQHLAYRFLDPALAPSKPTAWEADVTAACLAYFRQVDDLLGSVLRRAGPGARVFIASDHGFTATTEVVYINRWLHEQGLLHWREDVAADGKNALFSDRLASLANAIDLPRTRAYALLPSCNGIWLNVPPHEYRAARDDLIRRLDGLRGPDGGRVVVGVKKRETWFPGPFQGRAPDLTLSLRDFGFISVLNGPAAVVPRAQPSGTHHPNGVLMGVGPGLRAGERLPMRDILDVAPLLLHSLGLPIPAALEGTFPAEFYDSAYLADNPPRATDEAAPADDAEAAPAAAEMDEADQAVLFERLKSLGYVE